MAGRYWLVLELSAKCAKSHAEDKAEVRHNLDGYLHYYTDTLSIMIDDLQTV